MDLVATGRLMMKQSGMSADEFRGELKRLKLNQSSFAAASGKPLRTIQSWALGERSVPSEARLLIDKVENLPPKVLLSALTKVMGEDELKAMLNIVTIFRDSEKTITKLKNDVQQQGETLTAKIKDQEAAISAMKEQVERQSKINAWQAEKITALTMDMQKLSPKPEPFNG
jgi:DNA-binding transcriptional regulator YiaG